MKFNEQIRLSTTLPSPYARRAWVEIGPMGWNRIGPESPYARRAWVEIYDKRGDGKIKFSRPTHVGRGLKSVRVFRASGVLYVALRT